MCNVAAIVGLVGAGLSFYQQEKAASEKEEWANEDYASRNKHAWALHNLKRKNYFYNAERINRDTARKYSAIDERIGQESVAHAQEVMDIAKDSSAIAANLTAKRSDVTGHSMSYNLDNIKRAELMAIENARQEMNWKLRAYGTQKDEFEAQADVRIANLDTSPIPHVTLPQPVQHPDPFAALIGAAGGMMAQMNSYYDPSSQSFKVPSLGAYFGWDPGTKNTLLSKAGESA